MFKINNKDTSVFIVNFERISHLVLVFLLLTLSRQTPAEYMTRNTQDFPNILKAKPLLEIVEKYVSYDIESLVTNIPV